MYSILVKPILMLKIAFPRMTTWLILLLLICFISGKAQDSLSIKIKILEQNGNYDKIIALIPQNTDSLDASQLYDFGNAYIRIFNTKKALPFFVNAVNQSNSNLAYLLALGNAYQLNSMNAKAKEVYQTILTIDSTNFNAKIQLANIYKQDKDYQSAFEIYTHLNKKDFYNPYYWEKMGFCKYMQDSLYEAMYYYAHALICDSTDLNVINSLCNLYMHTQNFWKGYTVADEGLKIDSLDKRMLKHRAYFAQKQKYYDSAFNDYQRLIGLGDSTWEVFLDHGICAFQRNNYSTAVSSFMKAHHLKDDDPTPLVYLGMTYSLTNQWEQSDATLREAEELLIPKEIATVYYYMAKNKAALQNYDTAIAYFHKSLSRNPELTVNYYELGRLYDQLKNYKSAKAYYEHYLNSRNTNPLLVESAQKRIIAIKEELFFDVKH